MAAAAATPALVAASISAVPPPRVFFVTGAPGAGKTTLIRAAVASIADALPAVATDASGTAAAPPAVRVERTGFYTAEVRTPGAALRSGFDVVTLDGTKRCALSRDAKLSHLSASAAPTVGRYVVDIPAFEAVALPALIFPNAAAAPAPAPAAVAGAGAGASLAPALVTRLLVCDEIGKMELFSAPFRTRVTQLLLPPKEPVNAKAGGATALERADATCVILCSIPVPPHTGALAFVAELLQHCAPPHSAAITVTPHTRAALATQLPALLATSLRHYAQPPCGEPAAAAAPAGAVAAAAGAKPVGAAAAAAAK